MTANALRAAAWSALLAAGCAGSGAPPERSSPAVPARVAQEAAGESDDALGPNALPPPAALRDGTYLAPNVEDVDGAPGFLHVTEGDMPLVVAIGHPPTPPRDGSRADARRVAIEAMQQWEQAIAPRVPWFRLEFVEKDPSAAVQVIWRRRMLGPWGGWGGLRWEVGPDGVRVGGMMEISTTPAGTIDVSRLALDELHLLVAHEFGHVLGLSHCLDCDSAMNYAWETTGRVVVTRVDVETFLALLAVPSGTRADGRRLRLLDGTPR